MKRAIKFFTFLMLLLIAAHLWMESRRLPDLSHEIHQRLTLGHDFALDRRWDRVIVIFSYNHLYDREGINLSSVRRQFGDHFNREGSSLVIFVKGSKPVATAELDRKWEEKLKVYKEKRN